MSRHQDGRTCSWCRSSSVNRSRLEREQAVVGRARILLVLDTAARCPHLFEMVFMCKRLDWHHTKVRVD